MRDNILLDEDIREWIGERRVYLQLGYPCVTHLGKVIKIHQFVMGRPPEGFEIDHINRNKLDNRRSNLRFITHSENLKNRACYGKSGYKGVFFDKHSHRAKPWKAEVRIDGKKRHIGYYHTKEEAAIAVRPFISYK